MNLVNCKSCNFFDPANKYCSELKKFIKYKILKIPDEDAGYLCYCEYYEKK